MQNGPVIGALVMASLVDRLRFETLPPNTVYAPDDTVLTSTSSQHCIVVYGWGQDATTGVRFWRVQNSYGTDWSDGGVGRIARGTLERDWRSVSTPPRACVAPAVTTTALQNSTSSSTTTTPAATPAPAACIYPPATGGANYYATDYDTSPSSNGSNTTSYHQHNHYYYFPNFAIDHGMMAVRHRADDALPVDDGNNKQEEERQLIAIPNGAIIAIAAASAMLIVAILFAIIRPLRQMRAEGQFETRPVIMAPFFTTRVPPLNYNLPYYW